MRTATRVLGFAGALALVAGSAAAQNGNDATFNNAADFYTLLSIPSIGSSTGTFPPDIAGDLFWRSFSGANYMNDVDSTFGSTMEINGYFEALLSEFWDDAGTAGVSVNFLDRAHGHAIVGPTNALEPEFLTAGWGGGSGTDILVTVGPSGFKSPCTAYPSLCSPVGSSCAAGGGSWSWIVDIPFPATPGSGVVMPADGSTASDMATTYFTQGGFNSTGGACGIGTLQTSALISTDESEADVTAGLGINTMSGFQLGGVGAFAWGVATTMEPNIQFRGNILNMRADTGLGLGVEESDNGGGATNGEFLSVGSGLATLGVELRDIAGALAGPNVAVCGASLTPLPNPGFPALGGTLLVLPDGLFSATSTAWTGAVAINSPWFTTEGRFVGAQLPVPTTAAGAVLNTQGATFSLLTFTADTTNVAKTYLLP